MTSHKGAHITPTDEQSTIGGYKPAYTPGQQGSAANNAYSNQTNGGASRYSRNNPAYAARKMPRGKKIAIGVVSALAIILICAGSAFALWYNNVARQLNEGDKTQKELAALDNELKPVVNDDFNEPFYMLLIGSDRRAEDGETTGYRSDTNILVRVDATQNLITMVSIPRDTKIDFSYTDKETGETREYGINKFNAAYAFEQAPGTISATRDLLDLDALGIDISYYAEVNFQELVSLVNAVDGVYITPEVTIDDPDADGTSANPDWPRRIFEEGQEYHMYGDDALAFARSRAFADGDFTRTQNQRQLIMAIVQRVLDLPVTQMPAVIEAASQCVTTNMAPEEILKLAEKFKSTAEQREKEGKDGITVYSAMLPSWTGMEGAVSYVFNDEEKTREVMETMLKGEDPSDIVSDGPPADFQSGVANTNDFWDNSGGDESYEPWVSEQPQYDPIPYTEPTTPQVDPVPTEPEPVIPDPDPTPDTNQAPGQDGTQSGGNSGTTGTPGITGDSTGTSGGGTTDTGTSGGNAPNTGGATDAVTPNENAESVSVSQGAGASATIKA